jgi:hypothetical protein
MAKNLNFDVSEKVNITIRKGDTVEIPLTFKDSSGVAVPLVTNGYEFFMQVRKPAPARSRNNVVQKTSEYGDLVIGTITKGQNEKASAFIEFRNIDDSGNVVVYISSDYTKSLEPGSYVYDIQQIVNEKTTTILEGSFSVTRDISNVDAL